ncbi:MAG: helix-turn-helix domain-containing protein [Devosia sp.]
MESSIQSAKRFRDPAKSIVERVPDRLVVVHQHPGLMHEPHWHAQVEVNFLFSGNVRYRMQGHDLELRTGELAIFWGGLPHQMTDASEDAMFIAIHLPLVHFFRMRMPSELTHKLIHGATMVLNDHDQTDFGNFERWSKYMRSGNAARTDYAINELLLRIGRIQFEPFRLIEPAAVDNDPRDLIDHEHFRIVRVICEFIADNFREDIDMNDIAARADVHPKSAMRIFKKTTGMTLHKYLSLLRLSYAQALLMNEDMSVIDVAMECGYGSLGAFNTSFARLAGKSPSQFRRDSRAVPTL